MCMKQYLLDTFRYNDETNRKLLEKITLLPEKEEAIRHFSHLVNSQLKWMARIQQDPSSLKMSWCDPLYPLDALESAWRNSLAEWMRYIESLEESELHEELQFTGFDGGRWAATPLDIALQLNY